MTPAQNPPKVFVSYSTDDKILAGQVKAYFTDRGGFEVFLAHEDMEPSEEFILRIRSELKACNVFVPLITENFRESPWTDQEVGFALSRSKLSKGRRCMILSLVFAPAPFPPHGFIKDYQALSVGTNELQAKLRKAVKTIDRKLGLEPLRREVAIKRFCDSRSFASAKQNADELLPFAPFSLEESTRLARASVTNNQIYLPDELKRRVKRLLADHIHDLDAQLKAQVEQYFP